MNYELSEKDLNEIRISKEEILRFLDLSIDRDFKADCDACYDLMIQDLENSGLYFLDKEDFKEVFQNWIK